MRSFHPDGAFFGSLTSAEVRGVALRGTFRAALGLFPGLKVVPQRMFDSGEHVAALVTMQVTSGTSTEAAWCFRVESGLIKRVAVLWNPFTLLPGMGDLVPNLPQENPLRTFFEALASGEPPDVADKGFLPGPGEGPAMRLRSFGKTPEVAVLVAVGEAPQHEELWVFQVDGVGRVRSLTRLPERLAMAP